MLLNYGGTHIEKLPFSCIALTIVQNLFENSREVSDVFRTCSFGNIN